MGVDQTPKVDITSSPKSSANSKEKTQSDDIDHDTPIQKATGQKFDSKTSSRKQIGRDSQEIVITDDQDGKYLKPPQSTPMFQKNYAKHATKSQSFRASS